MIEQAIFLRATTGPTLAPLVGTGSRAYPRILPQDPQYPAIVFELISQERTHAMGSDPGLVHPRYQLTAFDVTQSGAKALAKAIITDFNRWRGTIDTTVIQDTFVENSIDLPWEQEIGVYQVAVDIIVHHFEP